MKKDPKKFFNVVYSKTVGNQSGNDGYIYRGRGFNQLTGRGNYKRMGEKIGMGNKLVENPELVNDPEIASKIAIEFHHIFSDEKVQFLLNRIKNCGFETKVKYEENSHIGMIYAKK